MGGEQHLGCQGLSMGEVGSGWVWISRGSTREIPVVTTLISSAPWLWGWFFCSLVSKSCPTLCNPMDCNLPGPSVHVISQSRILEWVAISFSRGPSWPRDRTWVSWIGRQILYCWATRESCGDGYIYDKITYTHNTYTHSQSTHKTGEIWIRTMNCTNINFDTVL